MYPTGVCHAIEATALPGAQTGTFALTSPMPNCLLSMALSFSFAFSSSNSVPIRVRNRLRLGVAAAAVVTAADAADSPSAQIGKNITQRKVNKYGRELAG